MRALFYDTATIQLENPIASGSTKDVTFQLFSNTGCTTAVDVARHVTVTFTDGQNGVVSTLDGTTNVPPAYLITSPGTFYWKVVVPKDSFNNEVSLCGEATAVSFP